MNITESSNPVLGKRFREACSEFAGQGTMTYNGTITKTILLFLLVILSGSITWKMAMVGNFSNGLLFGSMIAAIIFSLICCFKADKCYIFAPIYALCEGLVLGSISAFFNFMVEGIVLNAVLLTLGVAASVLVCYQFGILRASSTFVKVIAFATMGIAVFYIVSMILGTFGVHLSLLSMGTAGIVFQLVIVAIAALNLVLDFNTVESGVENQAPACMEWYGAFSIMVTLVWLYLEILRLFLMTSRKN